MKKIRFRIWNKDKKCFFTSDHTIGINNENKKKWADVQLSSGLFDKKGKEIFEGDFIKHDRYNSLNLVKLEDACFNAWTSEKTEKKYGEFDDFLGYQKQLIEVVGNIHESPDLKN